MSVTLSRTAPLVSVVIPTHNRSTLLRSAIDSVLNQTLADLELIVVDDGSTDGTREYLASVRDSRLRVVPLAHCGRAPRARNAGIASAKGEWVAFLDSDDLWLPEKLERQMSRLLASPQCTWCCTGVGFIDVDGSPVVQRSGASHEVPSGWILERLLDFSASAPIQTLLVRHELLAAVGGFDEAFRFRDDYDLCLRLAACAELAAVPATLALIRDHDGRMTGTQPVVELFAENEAVFRKAADMAPTTRVRALCIRQCAAQRANVARVQSRGGLHGPAITSSLRAIAYGPHRMDAWRCAAGVAIRALAGVTSASRI